MLEVSLELFHLLTQTSPSHDTSKADNEVGLGPILKEGTKTETHDVDPRVLTMVSGLGHQ